MMNTENNSLQLGIAAHNAGDKGNARTYFLKAVREQPNSEQAWGWLSNTAINQAERIHCLQQIIRINPENTSASDLLKQLETTDWATAAPSIQAPPPVATTSASAPSAAIGLVNPTTPAGIGSDTLQTIIAVLLVVLVLFWLGVGFLQIALGLLSTENTDSLFVGCLNVVFSIVNGLAIVAVTKRKKSVLQPIYILSVLGAVIGIFQLLFGAYLQACSIPLYILLGILTYMNREVFVN